MQSMHFAGEYVYTSAKGHGFSYLALPLDITAVSALVDLLSLASAYLSYGMIA